MSRKATYAIYLAIILGLAVLGLVADRFVIYLAMRVMLLAIFALGYNLLLGRTGLLSFGHGALYATGAYGMALVNLHLTQDPLLGILAGVALATACALIVGFFCVRHTEIYFAMLTLAFGMMFYTVAWKWYDLTGGDDGLMGLPQPDITLFRLNLASSGNSTAIYLFTLAILLLCFLFTWRVIHSPLGAVLEAIRENEERASFVGINVKRYKLIGWMLACGLAGAAGSLYILYRGYTGPGVMGAFEGAGVLMMVLLGGMGTLWGPFIGAALFIVLKDQLSSWTQDWEIFIGAIVILLVLFLPKGVAGLPSLFQRASGGEE